jgi:hypothetical protein
MQYAGRNKMLPTSGAVGVLVVRTRCCYVPPQPGRKFLPASQSIFFSDVCVIEYNQEFA